jgi:hypothetical protein
MPKGYPLGGSQHSVSLFDFKRRIVADEVDYKGLITYLLRSDLPPDVLSRESHHSFPNDNRVSLLSDTTTNGNTNHDSTGQPQNLRVLRIVAQPAFF